MELTDFGSMRYWWWKGEERHWSDETTTSVVVHTEECELLRDRDLHASLDAAWDSIAKEAVGPRVQLDRCCIREDLKADRVRAIRKHWPNLYPVPYVFSPLARLCWICFAESWSLNLFLIMDTNTGTYDAEQLPNRALCKDCYANEHAAIGRPPGYALGASGGRHSSAQAGLPGLGKRRP